VRRLRAIGVPARGQASLFDLWGHDEDVVLVDAVAGGTAPGTVHVWEGQDLPGPAVCRSSTHGLGVMEAIELAQALGRVPVRLRVIGIEGRCFDLGAAVSPEVTGAVEDVVARLTREVAERAGDGGAAA
jgi:hydrogenase maturation protease